MLIKIVKNNFNSIRRYLVLPVTIGNNKRCYSSTEQQHQESAETTNSKSSVDAEEMRRFKGLSHSWWIENGGEFEALHKMNKSVNLIL